MFRGEPLAFWTIMSGFTIFFLLQVFGIFISLLPGELGEAMAIAHYFLAFFGWIGLVILGAQLQFYRALTGLRRYGPSPLRFAYLASLLTGLSIIVLAPFTSDTLFVVGLGIYGIGVLIHLGWLVRLRTSPLFKFPLDYYLSAEIFHVAGIVFFMLYYAGVNTPFELSMFTITHVLTIGWISLTLQGALIRALPMFLGQVINRKLRPYLSHTHWFSVLSSLALVTGFLTDSALLYSVGGSLWLISWIWALFILITSIKPNPPRELIHAPTIAFFLPGLFWLGLAAIIGMITVSGVTWGFEIEPVHIHLALLAGLSLIMLGAIHRITAFQIYTLLYTGRRQETSVTEATLLEEPLVKYIVPFINVSPLIVVAGFLVEKATIIVAGGVLNLLSTLALSVIVYSNTLHYLKHRKEALPYYLKKGEQPQ